MLGIGSTYAAQSIVLLIVTGLLDVVPPYYRCISVVVVTFVCGEIDFP